MVFDQRGSWWDGAVEQQKKSAAPRPPAVASACLFVGMSSGLLLVYVIGWLTSWQSLEMQKMHREIADSIGTSDVAAVADALRFVLYFMIVVLVAGVVGAIYASRGDLQSRVLVTIVAAITAMMFLMSGGLLGILPGVFAAFAIVQLWGRDSRRWFAIVNGREVAPLPVVPPAPTPGAVPPQPWTPPLAANGRPSSVSTAALVTVIASFAALGGSLLYLLIYLAVPHDDLVQAQLDSPLMEMVSITEADIREALTTSAVFSAIAATLATAAILSAWALSRRKALGHTALFVFAVVTVIVGVISIIGIPWAAAAIWVLVLLRRRETLVWLRD